jgi:glycine cleavage system H protein
VTTYYTKDHEWIAVDGETGTVGITDYAQSQLGDITYVELPEPGSAVKQGDAPCVVDSVKAASDVYAPVSGEVTEINEALAQAPELVNTEAESGGWLFRLALADAGQLAGLMDRATYDDYVKGL